MYIYGEGAPTVSTFGSIGDYYIDTKSETMYKCIDIITADIKHQFVSIDDRDLNEVM